jgi:NAD(P)-dependent dehydrogenase (short-subunit alcohol dehydrogenase family)
MDVERMDGKLALVTGAGSAIGRETALLCAP